MRIETPTAICPERRKYSWSAARCCIRPEGRMRIETQLVRRMQRACEHAGLGPGFSGHSPRVGMVQDLSAAGGEMPALMETGRWETEAMVYRYTRSQAAYRSAVARYYGLTPESLGRLGSQPRMEGL